jgi:hypothetical protein
VEQVRKVGVLARRSLIVNHLVSSCSDSQRKVQPFVARTSLKLREKKKGYHD